MTKQKRLTDVSIDDVLRFLVKELKGVDEPIHPNASAIVVLETQGIADSSGGILTLYVDYKGGVKPHTFVYSTVAGCDKDTASDLRKRLNYEVEHFSPARLKDFPVQNLYFDWQIK